MTDSTLAEKHTPRAVPRRSRWRWLKYIAWAILALTLVASAGSYAYVRRSLPQVSGDLRLAELSANVTIYRDDRGIPHIEAQNLRDLYIAQGFATAQDRLWEMDLFRRTANAQLAEVFGAKAVPADKLYATFQMDRAAERSYATLSSDTRDRLKAYADGVNAYIAQATASGRLPIEFGILGYKPAPWTQMDSVAIGKLMAFEMGRNVMEEVFRYQVRQRIGDRLTSQLAPAYAADAPIIIASDERGVVTPQAASLPPADGNPVDLSGLIASGLLPSMPFGSNSWVVSGKLTKSGKPILAVDPHLDMPVPSIWYESQLVLHGESRNMNVIGISFPGVPGISMGQNDALAWGLTNMDADVQDLYIERRNPDNPYQFEFQGKWEDATVYKRTLKVKGGASVPYEVVVTRHGPILSEALGGVPYFQDGVPKEALALKWAAHEATPDLDGLFAMNEAHDWSQFRQALTKFTGLPLSVVVAGVDGTIAYRATGLIPIRQKGEGTMPVPGWSGDYEWNRYIPFEQMPEAVNPTDGLIVTANNKIVGDSYPYLISHTWEPPHRARRITEALQSKPNLTPDDMAKLQVDYTNLQARSLLPILLPAVKKADLTPVEQQAIGLLDHWDYVEDAGRSEPLIYQLWWKYLQRQLYESKLGPNLFTLYLTIGVNTTEEALRQAAAGHPNDWLLEAGGLDGLALNSFKSAITEAVKLQGKEPNQWAWGKYHQLQLSHPFGGVKPVGWITNPSASPVGGSSHTPGVMGFREENGAVTWAAAWRQVVDLADITGGAHDVLTPGQAGHFLSPWYKDQAESHAKGSLYPRPFLHESYDKGHNLTLKP